MEWLTQLLLLVVELHTKKTQKCMREYKAGMGLEELSVLLTVKCFIPYKFMMLIPILLSIVTARLV